MADFALLWRERHILDPEVDVLLMANLDGEPYVETRRQRLRGVGKALKLQSQEKKGPLFEATRGKQGREQNPKVAHLDFLAFTYVSNLLLFLRYRRLMSPSLFAQTPEFWYWCVVVHTSTCSSSLVLGIIQSAHTVCSASVCDVAREVVECARRLLLTSVNVFFAEAGAELQTIINLFIALVFWKMTSLLQPYVTHQDGILNECMQILIVLSFVVVDMIIHGIGGRNVAVPGWIFISLQILCIGLCVFFVFREFHSKKDKLARRLSLTRTSFNKTTKQTSMEGTRPMPRTIWVI